MDEIYKSVIEAIIFSSDEPIPESEIIKAIKAIDGDEIEISQEDIHKTVDELNSFYTQNNSAINIVMIANGFTHATKTEYSKYVGYLSSEKSKRRLSQAALETLSIIAYKQPVTKPEIESIRGVNSDYILTALLEKQLITISGRSETIGRPLLYKTTDEFLKYFGLKNLGDLPKPREIEDIMLDEDFIEQKKRIMMNLMEENLEKKIKDESDNDDQDQ